MKVNLKKILCLIAGLKILSGGDSFAAGTWCIEDSLNPPCQGAAGRCTKNSDGSLGGFVAKTATVQSKRMLFSKVNVPYIGKFAQVCDYAEVSGNVRIPSGLRITGTTRVNPENPIDDVNELATTEAGRDSQPVNFARPVYLHELGNGVFENENVIIETDRGTGNVHLSRPYDPAKQIIKVDLFGRIISISAAPPVTSLYDPTSTGSLGTLSLTPNFTGGTFTGLLPQLNSPLSSHLNSTP